MEIKLFFVFGWEIKKNLYFIKGLNGWFLFKGLNFGVKFDKIMKELGLILINSMNMWIFYDL